MLCCAWANLDLIGHGLFLQAGASRPPTGRILKALWGLSVAQGKGGFHPEPLPHWTAILDDMPTSPQWQWAVEHVQTIG